MDANTRQRFRDMIARANSGMDSAACAAQEALAVQAINALPDLLADFEAREKWEAVAHSGGGAGCRAYGLHRRDVRSRPRRPRRVSRATAKE